MPPRPVDLYALGGIAILGTYIWIMTYPEGFPGYSAASVTEHE
ncbi:hypothetical protein [Nocardia sp. NPDC005366]